MRKRWIPDVPNENEAGFVHSAGGSGDRAGDRLYIDTITIWSIDIVEHWMEAIRYYRIFGKYYQCVREEAYGNSVSIW